MKILGLEISFSRESKVRTQPTVAECIVHELSKPENASTRSSFAKHGVTVGQVAPYFLPEEYDDIEFGSHATAAKGHTASRIVDGKLCRTVGEYREATDKKYGPGSEDMGGWSW